MVTGTLQPSLPATPPLCGDSPLYAAAPSRFNALRNRCRAAVTGRVSYALADQVVYSFGNMVVAALLSRHAPQREFGIYILTQRTMDVLIQCCNTLSWAPFTFNLAATPAQHQRTYRGSVLGQQLVACAFAMLLLLFAAAWASTPARGMYYGTFHPLLYTAAILLFREFNRRMYFADMRMREAFFTEAVTVALQIAAVAWCVHTRHADVSHTLAALAVGASAASLWWLAREIRTLAIHPRCFLADTLRNLRLGRWLLGSNMVALASAQANPWLLSATLGGGGVGAYAVCESIVNIPRVALVSLQNIFAPMLSRALAEGGTPRLRATVRKLDRLLFAGSALCAAAVVAVGPFLARLLFKTTPGNTRTLLFFLALNLVASASTIAQSYALSAIDRAGPTLYANLAGLLTQAATALWLVHTFALPGAAAAMLLGSLVVFALRQFFYTRQVPA